MGPGDYAEHERFLGIYTADLWRLADEKLLLPDIARLLASEFNEERLCCLFILRLRFGRAGHWG